MRVVRYSTYLLMAVCFLYYALLLLTLWLGGIFGLHNDLWMVFDLPAQPEPPSLALHLAGLGFSLIYLGGLGVAFGALGRIIAGGAGQDFRLLARRLRRLSLGLIGFWVGYNLIGGLVPWMLSRYLADTKGLELEWDPLDIDVVFLVIAVAIFAISGSLRRAWEAEEENRLFL